MEATPRGIPSVQLLQITNSFLFLGENLHLCRINLIFCWKILTDNYNFVLDSATKYVQKMSLQLSIFFQKYKGYKIG